MRTSRHSAASWSQISAGIPAAVAAGPRATESVAAAEAAASTRAAAVTGAPRVLVVAQQDEVIGALHQQQVEEGSRHMTRRALQ